MVRGGRVVPVGRGMQGSMGGSMEGGMEGEGHEPERGSGVVGTGAGGGDAAAAWREWVRVAGGGK